MDGLLLIAVIVVAVVVGKPLSYLNCNVIGDLSSAESSAYAFATNLGNYLNQEGGKIVYGDFIGASKAVCLEMKAIWGLSIALWSVLYSIVLRRPSTNFIQYLVRLLCLL
jgi:hypothetical protein